MGTCELCGEQTSFLQNVRVAGSVSRVCSKCKNYGVAQENNSPKSHSFYRRKKTGEEEVVRDDYNAIISKEMVKKGLTVKRLAEITNIKESSLTKYLSGKIHMDVATAKKIEKALHINLIESISSTSINSQDCLADSDEDSGLSLADLIKSKMKK